jgi:uncharacterized membrane protein
MKMMWNGSLARNSAFPLLASALFATGNVTFQQTDSAVKYNCGTGDKYDKQISKTIDKLKNNIVISRFNDIDACAVVRAKISKDGIVSSIKILHQKGGTNSFWQKISRRHYFKKREKSWKGVFVINFGRYQYIEDCIYNKSESCD